MKHPSENSLNMFASVLLGGIGAGLMLVPAHLGIISMGQGNWVLILPGAICFGTALLLQMVSVLRISLAKMRFVQSLSSLLLIGLAWVYRNNGYQMEGGILFFTGVMQLALMLPFINRYKQFDFLNLTFSLIGFSTGIYLAVSGIDHAQLNLSAYIPHLAIGFLVAAFLGTSAIIVPLRIRNYLLRLQALPWLAWCVIFIPSAHGANLIVPGVVILMIVIGDFLPWEQLLVPEDDILSRRVIMIASTIELTLLIFLSALLLLADLSFHDSFVPFITYREAAFFFFTMVSVLIYYEVITVIMTVTGLMQELAKMEGESQETELTEDSHVSAWNTRLARYIKPFMMTREGIRIRLNAQDDQINVLARQLTNEKKRNAQLILLLELSQQLENQLDQPVAAQLAVNTLERALNCLLASIYIHEPERKEFMLLAAAGPDINLIPPGYRQKVSAGVIGRAYRQRKTQIINDVRLDADYIPFENEKNLSVLIIPLIFNGHVNGIIALTHENINAFSSIDIGLAEAVAAELTRAWERSGYHQRLTDLIQAGSQLSAMVEPGSTAQEVAAIAREILQARFTFVHIQLGQERNFTQSASSGAAPHLLESLENSVNSEVLIQMAFQAAQPFRVRDVRKYATTSHLVIDNAGLRSMLTIPIRWHRMNIGAIFAFGKQNEVFFTENDESLAELLSIQTAGAFESTWLQQELRASLRITSLLYRLSNQIIQAENLEDAASDIAQTAHKLARSTTTGIVLLNMDGSMAAEVKIDAAGKHKGDRHPMKLVQDAMDSGQLIYFSQGQSMIRTCLPIQTPIRKYGAIWMDALEDPHHNPSTNPNDLQALVNQAAIALERSVLLVESRRQAVEIKAAYDKLEATYDQTLASLISALDARDRETEGHSIRVSQLAVQLGETLGYTYEQLKVLERGSLLHDIGKIGISDTILHKPGPLTEDEWKIMRLHPDIGAKIVEGIPFLQETIPLIRHHQERWDGTGYPHGLRGEEIPILARMFAIVDAFDALTSNRPYRSKVSMEEALQYIHDQAGVLFDPHIVSVFEKMVTEDKTGRMHPE
jgi:putative nucleotidyltransferase with HDIG domain